MSRYGNGWTRDFGRQVCLGSISIISAVAVAHGAEVLQVRGTGTDLLNGEIVHLKSTTPTGEMRKSTGIVELRGDLKGKVLYHLTAELDYTKGTLVKTGDQVFSGTIVGSEPVMIHDSKFRLEINLTTGAESGSVYLFDHITGPTVECELRINGTGLSADGNRTFSYEGTCTFAVGTRN
jgi:hypothetical protein